MPCRGRIKTMNANAYQVPNLLVEADQICESVVGETVSLPVLVDHRDD